MITRELIENYKKQNPVKYELKKAYFEAELAKQEPAKEVEPLVKVKRVIKK